MSPATKVYRKHYIPLESNPEVFTSLIHALGVSPSLEFTDVYSLDDPELLACIPRPAFALILIFPTSPIYEQQKAAVESQRFQYTGSGEAEPVIWFQQTIHNACGLYGILHAVSNGAARAFVQPDGPLGRLLTTCIPLEPEERTLALEASEELGKAHRAAAIKGDTDVPENAEDEVDFHYVCLVKSHKNGHLYEMDGDYKGPVDLGKLQEDEDVLDERALEVVRHYIRREMGENIGFSLMALIKRRGD